MKKQTFSDIRRSVGKLTSYAMKLDVAPSKDRKGAGHKIKHVNVPKSRELDEAVYKWCVQQRSVCVKVRGLEITEAANKLALHMGIESSKVGDGWLWRFRNRHGIGNKVEGRESGSANISATESFRRKFNRLMKEENLQLFHLYNADETALFWRSFPRNTQAFKNEDKIPGNKISEEKYSALLGENATGTHRLKSVIKGKVAKPRALKDCMHELPVVCYNTQNAWFISPFISDWFFTHFVPEVRQNQENVLRIAPEEAKALLLDSAPARPVAE